jgi:hypothetical protein
MSFLTFSLKKAYVELELQRAALFDARATYTLFLK